jgi:hypothetical protein
MGDYDIELQRVFGLIYRDEKTLAAAIREVFGETRRSTFYSIPEEDRNAIADNIKEQVALEIAEADALFFQQREQLRATIMLDALKGVQSGIRRLARMLDDKDSNDFNAIAAFKELGDILRNGIMVPDRKFTPEIPRGPESTDGALPLMLQTPSVFPLSMPMPRDMNQVKELKVTTQDGTIVTVVRPEVIEAEP